MKKEKWHIKKDEVSSQLAAASKAQDAFAQSYAAHESATIGKRTVNIGAIQNIGEAAGLMTSNEDKERSLIYCILRQWFISGRWRVYTTKIPDEHSRNMRAVWHSTKQFLPATARAVVHRDKEAKTTSWGSRSFFIQWVIARSLTDFPIANQIQKLNIQLSALDAINTELNSARGNTSAQIKLKKRLDEIIKKLYIIANYIPGQLQTLGAGDEWHNFFSKSFTKTLDDEQRNDYLEKAYGGYYYAPSDPSSLSSSTVTYSARRPGESKFGQVEAPAAAPRQGAANLEKGYYQGERIEVAGVEVEKLCADNAMKEAWKTYKTDLNKYILSFYPASQVYALLPISARDIFNLSYPLEFLKKLPANFKKGIVGIPHMLYIIRQTDRKPIVNLPKIKKKVIGKDAGKQCQVGIVRVIQPLDVAGNRKFKKKPEENAIAFTLVSYTPKKAGTIRTNTYGNVVKSGGDVIRKNNKLECVKLGHATQNLIKITKEFVRVLTNRVKRIEDVYKRKLNEIVEHINNEPQQVSDNNHLRYLIYFIIQMFKPKELGIDADKMEDTWRSIAADAGHPRVVREIGITIKKLTKNCSQARLGKNIRRVRILFNILFLINKLKDHRVGTIEAEEIPVPLPAAVTAAAVPAAVTGGPRRQ